MTTSTEFAGKGDKTIVRIVENGVMTDRAFESLAFAHSYAASQSIRLGLPVPEAAKKPPIDTDI